MIEINKRRFFNRALEPPTSTPILLQEPRGDLVDARPVVAHIPECSPSLQTWREANCSLDQREELLEQTL
jgi:hypothetical protein